MAGGQRLDNWETLAVGLAVGLLAHAAPVAAAVLLTAVLAGLFRAQSDTAVDAGIAPLASLALVACAAMIGGPQATIIAALIWRTGVELHGRGSVVSDAPVAANVHLWAAPVAALLYRVEAPALLVAAALCIAGVAWTDWLIRRLADWRLDAPAADAARAFFGAQAATLLPLIIFPAPQTCLAALVAMGAARALKWRPAPVLRYATARY